MRHLAVVIHVNNVVVIFWWPRRLPTCSSRLAQRGREITFDFVYISHTTGKARQNSYVANERDRGTVGFGERGQWVRQAFAQRIPGGGTLWLAGQHVRGWPHEFQNFKKYQAQIPAGCRSARSPGGRPPGRPAGPRAHHRLRAGRRPGLACPAARKQPSAAGD
jgi:hypothetical protein